MPTTEKQIRKFSCVIELTPKDGEDGRIILKDQEQEECLKDLCQSMPTKYWAIMHDMDVDDDSGQVKRPHMHLVLETNTRHTFLGVIRQVSEAFGVAQNRVSVRETRNENSSIRYLMHMDDPEKQAYLPFDVYTNDREALNFAILNKEDELNIESLIQAIAKSSNELELARKIGLKNYQRYRTTVADLVPLVEKQKRKRNNVL